METETRSAFSYLISQAYINNGQQRNANFINDLSNALLYRTGNIKTISDLFDDAKENHIR
ncbi:MAG: hypothetical protein CM15mV51_1210 [uncultured marine virus]|nr:MAG: hypothetical protein CM15mV51_1210 [uncultured marine virus]